MVTVNISVNVSYTFDDAPNEHEILELIKTLYEDARGVIDVYDETNHQYYLEDGCIIKVT